MVDSCSWVAQPSEEFTVASVWKWMEARQGVDITVTRCIWINLAPPKAQFLSWLAWRGRLKCSKFLQRIGVLSPNVSSLCVFCKYELETVNHVFLHCHFIWKLWANLVNWWNYKWVSPGSVEGLFLSWPGIKMKKKMLTVWKTLPVAVMWSVWRSRNDCVFNKVQPDWIALAELIKSEFFWLRRGVQLDAAHGMLSELAGVDASEEVDSECAEEFVLGLFEVTTPQLEILPITEISKLIAVAKIVMKFVVGLPIFN
ncbi:uncharacterized protein LOC114263217 [Camellia sinensis]|uniref:uncharacterized protein LOC114263217 n=1 Tax=Camellia sinensis TaxID=4442 RepID=UPI0010364568|nr:uncharacterized protein LOC114263217 [Camellia sinensis]